MKSKTIVISSVMAASMMMSANVSAGNKHHFSDYAKVTDVEPVVKTITHRSPRQECYTERVSYEVPVGRSRNNSHTSTIVGAILGGIAGKEIGRKSSGIHKDTATAVGAILGGSIGRDINKKRGAYEYTETRYRDEQRCETQYDTYYEDKIVGYKVTYRYKGNTYNTRMDYDPGNKIPVEVSVKPKKGRHY